MADQPLPSPRALLTSLISTIATPQKRPPEQPSSAPELTNPLRDLSSERRTLLSTLHVIFPSLLLPALDLLDRGLVTRIFVADEETPPAAGRSSVEVEREAREGEETHGAQPQGVPHDEVTQQAPAAEGADPGEGGEDDIPAGGAPSGREGVYMVRSIASTMRRKSEVKTYLVLTTPWSCTCPSFTFDAFSPHRARGTSGHPPPGLEQGPGIATEKWREGLDWSFGGLSLDGRGDDGGVSCCKHLLACVLAERWGHILERYVPQKEVSRAAMAGLIAEV